MPCWAEHHGRRVLSALLTGVLLHRKAYRGSKHEQDQPEAEKPMKKRALHIRGKDTTIGGEEPVRAAAAEGAGGSHRYVATGYGWLVSAQSTLPFWHGGRDVPDPCC